MKFEDLVGVVADVLGVNDSDLSHNSSSDNVTPWDSVAHMTIVSVLEEEYDVYLSEEEIIEALSLESMFKIVNEQLS